MRKFKGPLCFAFLLFTFSVPAQKNRSKFKFGEVKVEDFEPKVYDIDSDANAIVLADIGSSDFKGNSKGDFSLMFIHQKRIRIINKNGVDAATVEIPLYKSDNAEERIEKLEAVTYNIEDGKVVTTKLNNASIFKDKYDEHHTVKKFTFPNIKEGSIIEYKYTVSSPFYFNLQPWDFQGTMPRLWSEYTVTYPNSIFDFVVLKQGYVPFTIDTFSSSSQNYTISSTGGAAYSGFRVYNLHSSTITQKWAIKNVPSLKHENFISALNNYKSRVEFQLKRIKYSETHIEDYMGNWNQFVERLMKRENFGEPLQAGNGWIGDDLKRIISDSKDDYAKAKKVYEYLRDNFTCTSNEGLMFSKSIKKVFEDKSGTVADINLLLVAALKRLNFEAVPALLSTRDNGWANEVYPLLDGFNYVVCRVKIGDDWYLLDASDKNIGFNKLPERAYNGSARVIADMPILVDLSPDSLKESKVTTLFMTNDDNNITGSFSVQYGNFKSAEMRDHLSKMEASDYLKELKKEFSFDVNLSNIEIDSLKIPEEPLSVKYNIDLKFNDDIVYFNPVLAETKKENPFKAAERFFPVEMSACTDETYILNMEIPKGYKVEELPKSARVMLNGEEGMFEYIVAESGGRIQLRCRTQIKKATFDPEDYQTLRDFFGFIVNKENEQIVFKKVN
jgi:hypothetical protein